MLILIFVCSLYGRQTRTNLSEQYITANLDHICRYAYTEEMGDDFDEEGVSLTSSGIKTGDMGTKLGEDLEEDKRE